LVGGVLTVIGFWPLVFRGEPARWWAIGLGGFLLIVGTVLPRALAPIHTGWMWVGHVLGWINTRVLLSIVFYGLITPIGIIFRLLGKDAMRQAFAQDSQTYRVMRQPRPRSHMKYQY